MATTTFEIHPAIGVARVGNSPDFFVGPEPNGAPPPMYRDAAGRLLRQAAQFRIFRCSRDADGTLRSAKEVTSADATIEWTVHLVNRKGAAPVFPPAPSRRPVDGPNLRNAGHTDRSSLVVDPGPRTLPAGAGGTAAFDSGSFLGTTVPLGEMRAGAGGRLLVLGGHGASGVSPRGTRAPLDHFANNDNWFDDMSDGPVTAAVKVGTRRAVAATSAWVVAAPPDFAPGIVNFVTLYDVAYQAAVERGWRSVPDPVLFTHHVQPILQRALGYQWVLELGRRGHGPFSGFGDFTTRWDQLADPSPDRVFARELVLGVLRDPSVPPDDADPEFGMMPRLHHSDFLTSQHHVLRPTLTQYAVLKRWAAGDFVNDLRKPAPAKELLPDALDRVSLEACSGGPFFPGIELGSVMADAATYSAPFRVDAGTHQPGDLTAGNAVPWQADFLACSVDAQSQLGWWPAQRPYQVFPGAASRTSEFWSRGVSGFRGMVEQWHELGVVVPAVAPDGTPMFVESERRLT